jgi:hypothetical protein
MLSFLHLYPFKGRATRNLLWCACIAAFMLANTGTGWAQSTFGEFVGTVKDPSGSVAVGCVVTIKNTGTSATRSTTTSAAGTYTVVNLEPGTYEIIMEMAGFQKAEFVNIELLSRQTVRVDGTLQVSTQTQTVEVSTSAETPINTEVSNIAETKLGRELTDLPVAVASRASGSTSPYTSLTTQPGLEIDNNNNISIAGAKPSMLSISIDGISSMSPRNSAPITELFPSFDGIAEIHVSEINNTAEFGGISDVTTISKAGSNAFHGGVFENFENNDLNARNTFSATVPILHMNDFGGFLGGPVSVPKLYNGKDHTFFFMTYEGLRLPFQTVLVESVPTVALRSGNLSAYTTPVMQNGVPLPGNIIPATSIAPLSAAALKYLFPLPNTGSANQLANNFEDNFPTPISSNQGDARLDQNITSKQSVFARITYKRREVDVAPTTGTALDGPLNEPENDYSLTGAYNYIINPTMVNEFRAGYSGSNTSTSYGLVASTVAGELGLTPYLPEAPPAGNAIPQFKISGFQATGTYTSSQSRTSTTQILDNLTWTSGKHSVKFGADYRYLTALYTNVFASSRLGQYTFNNSVTKPIIGNAFGSFLLGVPDTDKLSTVLNPNTQGYSHSLAGYVQDDWKVTSRLTINFGLRYEYHPMFRDHLNNTANFLPDNYAVVNGVTVHGAVVIPDGSQGLVNPAFAQSILPTPILTASQAGLPESLRYSQKTDFAPRVGFAWRVTNDGKLVIRGGYGKFIEAELGNLLDAAWAVEASDLAVFTNTITGGKPALTFPYAFPANLAQPGTQEFDLSADLHYQDPYVQQWNFTIERDLGFLTALRVSYDGSHGTNLGLTTNPNQVPANTAGFSVATLGAPYPLWSYLVNETNGGVSNYEAVTFSVNKRMSKGLQMQASYNVAKNLSNEGGYDPTAFATEGGGQTTDLFHPMLDYGNVAFTRRQRFQATFLYAEPYHSNNKFLNQIVSGWELSGVLTFQTGPFLTVLANGADPSGTNFENFQGNGRADITSGASLYPASRSIADWINPAAFTVPANNIGRFGDSAVGAVVGPGTQGVSASLYRAFAITERIRLRFGVSAANLFNHPNYGVPALTQGVSGFGSITSLQTAEGSGPRLIQLSGRLTF